MNILYLSCHSIAEWQEVKMLTELGHDVVSQGTYRNPAEPGNDSRPAIENAFYDPELAALAPGEWGSVINKEIIDWCDVIWIHGIEAWLPPNWENIKHKHVIFRSIGQSVEHTESVLSRYWREGLKIVRYSPLEVGIPGYTGASAFIRFYQDPDEYHPWRGDFERVITVAQAMKKRWGALKYHVFNNCTRGFPRKLYGYGNEDAGDLFGGELSYDELRAVLRDNRCFFYTCTQPAQYTLGFLEAWMAGIPVVAIGQELAGYRVEVPELIEDGVNGFTSNNIMELRGYIQKLFDDRDLAYEMGQAGREKCIELFGKDLIYAQWKEFLEGL